MRPQHITSIVRDIQHVFNIHAGSLGYDLSPFEFRDLMDYIESLEQNAVQTPISHGANDEAIGRICSCCGTSTQPPSNRSVTSM